MTDHLFRFGLSDNSFLNTDVSINSSYESLVFSSGGFEICFVVAVVEGIKYDGLRKVHPLNNFGESRQERGHFGPQTLSL